MTQQVDRVVEPKPRGTQPTSSSGWVLALMAAATFMIALDTLVVTTALTTIQRDLGATAEQLEWTVNAYNLSFAVLILTAAALGDRFGRRRMLSVGLLLFVTASAASALAPDVGALIAARAAQGIGAALVFPLTLTILSGAFPPERRGAAIGVWGGLTGLAVASGPLVGGAIVEGIAWQWIFWVNVPIGLALIPLIRVRVPESFGPKARVDVLGLALVSIGSFGVVWGLVRGNIVGWTTFEVVSAFVAGAAALTAFVLWELSTSEPMLPMHWFRIRAFAAGNASAFFLLASLFGAVFLMAQYLQVAQGYSPLETGLRLLPWTATPLVVAPLAGAFADRIGERWILTSGLVLQGLGLAWIAAIADADLDYLDMLPALVVAGIGVSMAIPSAQSAVIGAVPESAIGKASGVNSTLRELGGVFGIALAVAVFTGSGDFFSPEAFTDGFQPALGAAAALSVIGAVCAALVPNRRPDRGRGVLMRDRRTSSRQGDGDRPRRAPTEETPCLSTPP